MPTRAVWYIALNTFRESVRDKVFYNLVLFAVLLIGASLLLGQLTAGQEIKIIKDLGLSAMSLFGLFIAVFIGIGLVSKEVDRKSIYTVLTKPITRGQFILGKFAGLVMTLAVNVVVMTVALYAVLATMAWLTPANQRAVWEASPTDPALLTAVGLTFVELMLLTAVALLFSTFSSPLLSAGLTIACYVIGHFNADLRNFEAVVDAPAVAWITRACYYVLPNLAPFSVTARVVHAQPVSAAYVAATVGYGLVYTALLLTAGMWIFSRRDFK
ncbi:MAG: ABC transporter permease [Vicinamibacterales bacterium]